MLAEAGDLTALDRLLDERWGEARSRGELLDLIPLAEPLVAREPEAGTMVHDAILWVEATLSDDLAPAKHPAHPHPGKTALSKTLASARPQRVTC